MIISPFVDDCFSFLRLTGEEEPIKALVGALVLRVRICFRNEKVRNLLANLVP